MSELNIGIVGFDITPKIDPVRGAWGTTPSMTEIDMPLLARCIALRQDDRLLIWFGSDLIGEGLADTDKLRDEVAGGRIARCQALAKCLAPDETRPVTLVVCHAREGITQ